VWPHLATTAFIGDFHIINSGRAKGFNFWDAPYLLLLTEASFGTVSHHGFDWPMQFFFFSTTAEKYFLRICSQMTTLHYISIT